MFPSKDDYEITPAELHQIRDSDDPPALRLIDCREEDEFALCRIDGGELIPLSQFAVESQRKLVGENRPIVVYCHHGMRSLNATRYLRQRGFEEVWSLAGGIDLWSRQIDPSVPRY